MNNEEKNNINGQSIRNEILATISYGWNNKTSKISKKLGVSTQTINKHIKDLIAEGFLEQRGEKRTKEYRFKYTIETYKYKNKDLQEDKVWKDIKEEINGLTEDALHILEYGFTEILNNAIEHSESENIEIDIVNSLYETVVLIWDDGIGIFNKIQKTFNLESKKYAILELAKGKLTSDPDNHTGEGIFFTSRAMDEFKIISDELCFTHHHRLKKDYLLDYKDYKDKKEGTVVWMSIINNGDKKIVDIFNEFSGINDGFTKTVVPVNLAQIEGKTLISRSQAKRILSRCDKFKEVIFDFEGVELIGQGFADQVFRVFVKDNPEINISVINANKDIEQMIRHVTN